MAQVLTDSYGRVFGVPGSRSLYGLALVARIPVTAVPVALTLRVVFGLHRSFADSGLVAAAVALGAALGAPILGRLVDHRGARAVLALTTFAQAVFWAAASVLSFDWLIPAAFVGGALTLPVFSLTRQAIAALLPAADRHAGMSLDSMSVEVSYSIGPALGVVAVTRLGSSTAMLVIGASLVVAGIGLFLLDPPTGRSEDQEVQDEEAQDQQTQGQQVQDQQTQGQQVQDQQTQGRQTEGRQTQGRQTRDQPGAAAPDPLGAGSPLGWLTPVAVAALVATCGATFTLSGTDIALTASMRAFGHTNLLGAVVAMWSFASLIGGFFYGLAPRRLDPLLLLIPLAALTVPMAFAPSWVALLLLTIPAGLFCAPLLSATAEVIARVARPAERGRALGFHTSALTLGNAAGAPLAGLAIDRWSPAGGFVTIGVLGALAAVIALAVIAVAGADNAKMGGTMGS